MTEDTVDQDVLKVLKDKKFNQTDLMNAVKARLL